MITQVTKIISWKNYLILFILLLISYFSIGLFLINHQPLTGDEVAHLSAGQGISQGQDLNLEHPPLLKALNGVLFKFRYSNYSDNDSNQWHRSIRMMEAKENDSYDIIKSSRTVYLIFNSLLLFWLVLYTCILKLVDPKFSLLLGGLYVFSPSFYSHNYLVTFDVAGTITALMSIFSIAVLFLYYHKFNRQQKILHFTIVTSTLFLAISSKFSNIILAPTLLFFGLSIFGYNIYKKNYQLVRNLSLVIITILFSLLILTWTLYNVTYTTVNIAKAQGAKSTISQSFPYNNSLTRPFLRFGDGLLGSMGRSGDLYKNFVNDHYEVLTYPSFINRVFWYKENPGLIILLAVSGLLLSWNFLKRFVNGDDPEDLKWLRQNSTTLITALFILLFPILYLAISWNSRLTIGYRHFYPVLIFIYFGVAWLLSKLLLEKRNIFKSLLAVVLVIIYSTYGILGITQSISYVNPFWTKEKWRLTTDSTLAWADTVGWGLRYMTQSNLLKKTNEKNKDVTWNTKLDVYGGPPYPVAVKEAVGKENRWKSLQYFKLDLTQTKISDLDVEYMIVDITSFQKLSAKLYDKKDKDNIAKDNFEYLNTHTPVHEINDIVFIYKLN